MVSPASKVFSESLVAASGWVKLNFIIFGSSTARLSLVQEMEAVASMAVQQPAVIYFINFFMIKYFNGLLYGYFNGLPFIITGGL